MPALEWPILDWIAAWPGAAFIKDSGTAYLFVNAAHILGISLLLGAILPLDLRLAGMLRGASIDAIGPFLLRAASVGLLLAVITGLWLFSVKPKEYVDNAAFLYKLGLLALALLNVVLQHCSRAFQTALCGGAIAVQVRALALMSALLWLPVLVAGRWIGFL